MTWKHTQSAYLHSRWTTAKQQEVTTRVKVMPCVQCRPKLPAFTADGLLPSNRKTALERTSCHVCNAGLAVACECYQKAPAATTAVLHLQILCSHCCTSAGRKSASDRCGESVFIRADLIRCVFAEARAQPCKVLGVSGQCSHRTAGCVKLGALTTNEGKQ